MLEFELDDSLADLCQDVADPQTRIALHGKKRLSLQFVQDLMKVSDRQTLQERVSAVFRQYRRDHNPDFEITDPLKVIVRQYGELAEFGVKFECADIEVMGDYALKTATYGVKTHLFHEIAVPLVQQFISVCAGKKKTGAIIASVDALQRSGRRSDVEKLELPQRLVRESLERIILALPLPISKGAPVDYGDYITGIKAESIQVLAEQVKDKDILKKMIRQRLQEPNVHADRLIPIAAVTGDFADLEAFCHTIGLAEEGVHIQRIYEISKAPHLLHRLEDIAWQQIREEQFTRRAMSVYPWIRKFVEMGDAKILALADDKIAKAFPKMEGMDLMTNGALASSVRNVCYPLDGAMVLYESLGMSERDIHTRVRDIALDKGALKVATRLLTMYGDSQARYQVGLKYAEQGDFETAFHFFHHTNLEQVATNDRLFYETIARRMVPALASGIPPERLKQKINSIIKKFCIRDISADGGNYTIDFGVGYFSVRAGNMNVVSRNSVRDISYGFIVRDIHKKHQNEEELKAEKFWIEYLTDKIPVKRVIMSSGNKLVLETSSGIPLLDAAQEITGKELKGYLERATVLADSLYQTVNGDADLREQLDEAGIEYKLDRAVVDHRFERFLKSVEKTSLRKKIKEIQPRATDYFLESKLGITHADFSPRNLMIEDENIIVIDHENYYRLNFPTISPLKNRNYHL